MKYLLTLFIGICIFNPGYSQFDLYYAGRKLVSGTTLQIRRGQPVRIVASLRKQDADMDDIDNVPDEVKEWKDSIGMGDSVIVEYFDWKDPARTLDTNSNLSSLDFFYDTFTEEESPFNIQVEIIDSIPAELELYPDQMSFVPLNAGGIASFGLNGLSLIDSNLNGSALIADSLNLFNTNGMTSFLAPGSLGLNRRKSMRGSMHIKQETGPALALENNIDSNTYIFDISTNDLHVLYDVDGPGPNAAVKITELDDATGAWQNNSDLRLKKEIEPLDPILEKVVKLQPKSYLYRYQSTGDARLMGFVAQEVKELFPSLVHKSTDGFHTLNYHDFGVLAIKAIQEQQEVIETLEDQLERLKIEVERLASKIPD